MPYRNKEDRVARDRQYNQRPEVKARRRVVRATPAAKARARAAMRRWKYGLSAYEFDSLFDAQGRRCPVCYSTESNVKRGWQVDHDHVSGAIRGVLCGMCNPMLGLAQDDPDRLRRAAAYLDADIAKQCDNEYV